jgi:hypothetical protein
MKRQIEVEQSVFVVHVGQTQTSGRIPARSVLSPTTDMRRLRQHFRLVPFPDSCTAATWPSALARGAGTMVHANDPFINAQ